MSDCDADKIPPRADNGGDGVKAPTLASLRESGQIEQDADAILLLYLEDPSKPNESRRVLKLAKNKDGERGRIYLTFDGAYQRFRQSVVEQVELDVLGSIDDPDMRRQVEEMLE